LSAKRNRTLFAETIKASGNTYEAWNVALAYTRKETEPSGGTVTNEEQLQVSAGYAFDFGLGIDLGWKTARNAGVDTDTFGTLLTYTIEY
jgi:hypothetical protein